MKKIFETIIKRVKLRTIILLIILLTFNAYAWFIYATKVSGTLIAHVTSWNVQFRAGEGETVTNVEFDVGSIYPGMDTYTETIKVYNRGEVVAYLAYEIESVTILGNTYEPDGNVTSEELVYMLENDFPFSIIITIDKEDIDPENGEATFQISVEWPFDSNDDEFDTEWGELAYNYHSNNPDEQSIYIKIKLTATQ